MNPRVLLYLNEDSCENYIKEYNPKLELNLLFYDLDNISFIKYMYMDIGYEVSKYFDNKKIISDLNKNFNDNLLWIEHGSIKPLTDYIKEILKINNEIYLIIKNIGVPSINRSLVGAIIFEIIQSNISNKIIFTCHKQQWDSFDQGDDIFKKITSRMKNSVKLCEKQ